MKVVKEFIDTVRDLARAAEPWPGDVAEREKRIARQMMGLHQHEPLARIRDKEERQMTWENCGACVLARAGRDGNDPKQIPNHAGWLRCYIQAGEAVPMAWLQFEMVDSEARNPAYHAAILRDVATYGIHRAHDTGRKSRGWTPDYGTEG